MPHDAVGSEQRRFRTGLFTLVAGSVLMVWAWGSWIYRSSVAAETVATMNQAAHGPGGEPSELAKPVSAMGTLMIGASVLIVVVLVAASIMRRSARRHFGSLGMDRATPTPFSETWSQHRLPDDGPRPSNAPEEK